LAPIELRTATVTDVRPRERIIELIAAPYDEWTTVEYRGRMVEESFAPGAFGKGLELRADRYLINLEHDPQRRIGKCVTLKPDDPRGLWAAMKIRRGPEGDQALDDAEDGLAGASVGFGAMPEHTDWPTRTRRRIRKAYLDHIALTWTPAYPKTLALAVRSSDNPDGQPLATPNLDSIRYARLAAEYDRRQI
jgi:HK97 family phage prohead protease